MTPRKPSRSAQAVAAILDGGSLSTIRAAEDLLEDGGRISVRCSAARKRLYESAAKKRGVRLSTWVIATLDRALERRT